MDPVNMAEKELTHIRALSGFRLGGEHVAKGTVLPKTAFPSKGDWHTLCHMTPPRAEECGPESKPVKMPAT
jgi:hypothetical protein